MSVNWNRRLVPKWSVSSRPIRIFRRTQNLSPEKKLVHRKNVSEEIKKALHDFGSEPSLGVAADALRLAVDSKSVDDLREIALFVAEHKQTRVPEWLRKLAETVAYGHPTLQEEVSKKESNLSPRQAIQLLRRRLREYPANPLDWTDYARLQTTKGKNDAAKKAIKAALELAPNSRFVVRSATRFYLHLDDPERALFTLNRTQRTNTDPWLMAGQISVSSILGRSSKLIKRANNLVEANSLPWSEVTELASALATLDLSVGKNKSARKLFDISLRAPNDNALAQAEWASKVLKIRPDLPNEWLSDPTLAEAAYYRAFLDGELETAIEMARNWHDDEPFASRPMISASFLASLMGRMYEAESYAKLGLVAEPNNLVLLNNYAYALTSLGNYVKAIDVLKKVVNLEKRNISGQTLANFGFLTYLSGDFSRGAQYYRTAVTGFKRLSQIEEASAATAFHLRAARMANAPGLENLEEEALSAARGVNSSLAKRIAEIVVNKRADVPDKRLSPVMLKQSWHYDAETNLLTLDPNK